MPNTKNPPKLTVSQLISHMRDDLGLAFRFVSEEQAFEFLQKNNFYYRLKPYMANFGRNHKGRFLDLDFGHLRELSTIDMYLRKLLFKMSVDAEHYFKVHLVNDCQNNSFDDGYAVVGTFFKKHPAALEKFKKFRAGSSYGIAEDSESLNVWTVAEFLPFLEMTTFFEFYYDYFEMKDEFAKLFVSVRRIRNASAHNSCMLNALSPVQNFKYDPEFFVQFQNVGYGLTHGEVASALKVPFLNDFAVMLKAYSKIVSSPNVKTETFREMQEFFTGRMRKRKDWFEKCGKIRAAYKFALAVLNYFAGRCSDVES